MLQYLTVCPLVSLAGLVDSIADGGGFIVPPAYLIVGVPAHVALGTNELNSVMDTIASTAQLAKHGFLKEKVLMAVCSSAAALMGSVLGAHLAFMAPRSVIKHMMIVVLPIVAFYVLKNEGMGTRDRAEDISRNKVFAISMATAFLVGGYDGFYGSGTGAFLTLILAGVAGMDARSASAQTKVINLSSNMAALVTFIVTGNAYYLLGLTVGVCSTARHCIGVGIAAHDDQKAVHPVVLTVPGVLFIKIIGNT